MLFNSLQFLVFFLIVYSLYVFLKHKWQNRLLIAASCIFYASWNWKFLFLMVFSISVDFFCGRYMARWEDQRKRRMLLFLSIFVNLSILGFFKYFNFFSANLQSALNKIHALDSPVSSAALNIILPLGISFYTFEAISYVVDVYRRQVKPARSYWDYLLFVLYFPHLVAGPIMRAKTFLPQITAPRVLRLDQFYEGCHLFFWGLFEKIFVADNMAKIVNPIFASGGPYEGSQVLVALYAFAFQIFCDFDGYSNMARGLGKCMGFDITINFNLPYFSQNPREFWQRWHISLSTWLRDYLYIPLGGNRSGQLQMCCNLLITMLLGGLWHGASWTFVLWGLYHGVLLVGYHLRKRGGPSQETHSGQGLMAVFKMVIFFHVVLIGWLLFRAQDITQAGAMITALFSAFQPNNESGMLFSRFVFLALPLLIVQINQYRNNDLLFVFRQHWIVKKFIYALMTYLLLVFGAASAQDFIYFQF